MKTKYIILIFISILSLALTHFETPFQQQITNDDTFLFTWSINSEEQLIKFELDVKTTGWVGLGISPTGTMINSDMFIGYIQKDGKTIMNDRFSTSHLVPSLDTDLGGKDDLTDVTGTFKNGRTSISFVRKLVTGDKNDIDISKDKSYTMIFSYREQGNPETENSFLIHSGKFSKELILHPSSGQSTTIQTLAEKYKDQKDIRSMYIAFDKVEVPEEPTAYTCRYFNVNDIINKDNNSDKKDTSYHAVGFEAAIDNEAFVHHIVVFGCDMRNVLWHDKMFRCDGTSSDCQENLFGWAPGQKTIEFPPEAGMLWGTNNSYFVMMQIHYNNPTKVANQVDSTGVTIFYTHKLRQYDIGVTLLGPVVFGITIPPNKQNVTVSNTCPVSCMNTIPEDGFKVIIHFFHAHKLGRKVRAIVKKPDGTIDSTTFRTDAYDFEHQNLIISETPYEFKRGYSMETICEYDSTGMDKLTTGGIEQMMRCVLFTSTTIQKKMDLMYVLLELVIQIA